MKIKNFKTSDDMYYQRTNIKNGDYIHLRNGMIEIRADLTLEELKDLFKNALEFYEGSKSIYTAGAYDTYIKATKNSMFRISLDRKKGTYSIERIN